jgi:hypothetical protein
MNNQLEFLKDWGCIRKGEKIYWGGHTVNRLIKKHIAKHAIEQIYLNARTIKKEDIEKFVDYKMKQFKQELVEFINLRQ